MDAVIDRLDGVSTESLDDQIRGHAEELNAGLEWMVDARMCPNRSAAQREAAAGRRATALAYAMNPSIFNGRNLRQIAEDTGTDYSRLKDHVAHARRILGGLPGRLFPQKLPPHSQN